MGERYFTNGRNSWAALSEEDEDDLPVSVLAPTLSHKHVPEVRRSGAKKPGQAHVARKAASVPSLFGAKDSFGAVAEDQALEGACSEEVAEEVVAPTVAQAAEVEQQGGAAPELSSCGACVPATVQEEQVQYTPEAIAEARELLRTRHLAEGKDPLTESEFDALFEKIDARKKEEFAQACVHLR